MSINKQAFSKWMTVVTGFLLMGLVFAPAINMAGLFVPYLEVDFNATRTAIIGVLTMSTLGSVIGYLVVGKAFAKWDVRYVMTICIVVFAACYVLATYVKSVFLLYALGLVRGVSGAFITLIPISVVLNNRFEATLRGRALGIALMGSGVAPFVLNPVVAQLIETTGWRKGYLLFAGLALCMIPLVLLTFRLQAAPAEAPEEAKGGAEQAESHINAQQTVAQTLKSANFWIVLGLLFLLAGVCHNWNNNGASYLRDIGFNHTTVATLLSITALGVTVARPVYGFVADKWGTTSSLTMGTVSLILGYGLASLAAVVPVLGYVAVVFLGFGISVASITGPLLTADLFAKPIYASLIGFVQIGSSLGASAVPLLMTALYELFGSYIPAWCVAIAFSLLVLVLMRIVYKRHAAK